jgi:porphobilinogen synthase
MLYWAAHHGVFELRDGVFESLNAMLRSGASILISYFVPQILDWLKENDE